MGRIRPLAARDMTEVAALFQRVFRRSHGHAPAALCDYLQRLYLEGPACADDVPSLVHETDDGRLSAFIGRHSITMRLGDRRVRAAMLSTIMADERAADPLAGAKILKAALGGPQDFSFSETASEVSMRMWKPLGGVALPGHSLEWLRIIRPMTSAIEASATRFSPFRFFAPLASGADDIFRGRIAADRPRWLGLTNRAAAKGTLAVREVSEGEFSDAFRLMTGRFVLRPDWTPEVSGALLAEAMNKPRFGMPVLAVAEDRAGKPAGCFFYHLRPRGTARVIQLLALPGKEDPVLETLIAHAADRGASAIRGRTQPFLMEAMLGRRIGFINSASTVLHCRDPEIIDTVRRGEGFLNGLAGEQWSRLIGGEFG